MAKFRRIEERHDRDQAGRPDRQRRRRAAVHFLLPPGRFHPRDDRGLRARAESGRARRDRANPDQLAHVRDGAPADLPGYRHRHRVPARRHERAVGRRAVGQRAGQRGHPPRLPAARQRAARFDSRGSRRRAQKHQRQHAGRDSLRNRAGRHGRGARRRQGRRQRGQVEVRDAEPVGLGGRLGARDGAEDGRRLVPAGHARHRHRRHRGKGDDPRQGSAARPDRYPRPRKARRPDPRRGAAPRALRQGQPPRHRRAGPRRADDGARRQGQGLPVARGQQGGRDHPELRRDAARALHPRRQRTGEAEAAETRRLARGHPRNRRQRPPRQSGHGHARRGQDLEARRHAAAVGQDADRARRGAQAHGRPD